MARHESTLATLANAEGGHSIEIGYGLINDSLPPQRHGAVLAFNTAFQEAVDALEEIVAVPLVWKPMIELPRSPSIMRARHGPDPECLGVWPRNVPERDDCRLRQSFPNHPRQKGKVIVLHEDNRSVALRFPLPPHQQSAR